MLRKFSATVSTFVDLVETAWRVKAHPKFVFSRSLQGEQVFVDDDLVFMQTQLSRSIPLAMVDQREHIWANRAFLEAPGWYQRAILAHEKGHLALGHLGVFEGKSTLQIIMMGRDIALEYEADRWAQAQGHDVAGALIYLSGMVPECTQQEICLRLANLNRPNR